MPTHVTDKSAVLQARMPRELVERAEQYAARHRCKVSELLREGLEMRLEVDVPGRSPWTAPPEERLAHEELSDDVRQLLEKISEETVRRILQEKTEGMEHKSSDVRHVIYVRQETDARTTDTVPYVRQVGQRKRKDVSTNVAPVGQTDQPGETRPAPDYDASKFYLGAKLCPDGDDYQGTGRSLIRRSNQRCVECDKRQKRDARARKRATAQAQEG